MKRFIYIFSVLFLLSACQKEAPVSTLEKTVVTYTVQTPVEFELKSTSDRGQGAAVNALWYGVYHKKADGKYVYMSDMSAYVSVTDASKNISVPITLFKDQEYRIAFIAQHISDEGVYTYILQDDQMVLNPNARITDGEQLDAFGYWEETGIIKHDFKKNIELTRPLGQINIVTTSERRPQTIDVRISSGSDLDVTFSQLSCSDAYLATVYILPPVSGKVNVELTMHYPDGTAATKSISDVSVAPNYRTNITGNI